MKRKMVLLTWGHSNPRTAKTAAGLLRYCPDECVAVFDPDNAGRLAKDFLETGGNTPIIARLDEAPGADTLVMGIAPPGGRIPPAWRAVLLDAIDRGMHLLSGLHDFLSDDPELANAAASKNVKITDVRKNNFRQIARREGINPNCCRIHTVGHDCSVGKMVVSLELSRGLNARGRDAQFVATGQTGIMVAGAGLPLDCIVADFVSGGAEQLVLENQHHEFIVVEGQGSLVHPSYSGVTLSLLHGCMPHALIFVFEAGRDCVGGLEQVKLPSLAVQRNLFETLSSLYQPCKTIGFAMNGRRLSSEDAHRLAQQVENEMQLPVVDVLREGADRLVDAVEHFYTHGNWRS
jgi:uncharacterized NAD-dependent epimerase/dehydratase family protein